MFNQPDAPPPSSFRVTSEFIRLLIETIRVKFFGFGFHLSAKRVTLTLVAIALHTNISPPRNTPNKARGEKNLIIKWVKKAGWKMLVNTRVYTTHTCGALLDATLETRPCLGYED